MSRPALYRNVAKRIFDIEGFEVRIKDEKGNELNPDDTLPVMYPLGKMSKNNWRVSEWQTNKFARYFPNHKVDVLDVQGNVVRRYTILGTVRDTYLEESD